MRHAALHWAGDEEWGLGVRTPRSLGFAAAFAALGLAAIAARSVPRLYSKVEKHAW